MYLAGEYAALFFGLPLCIMAAHGRVPLLLMLGSAAAVCLAMLLMDRGFDRRRLWNSGGAARELPRIVGTFAVVGVVLWLLVSWGRPEILWYLPRQRPLLFGLIVLLYPLLSVYPQNLIYRAFIFHRYRTLFRESGDMIFASAAAFAFAHVIFENVLALLLTAIGGLLFAYTYGRTRSTLAASVEHALYGVLLFAVGLGWYVYLGAVR